MDFIAQSDDDDGKREKGVIREWGREKEERDREREGGWKRGVRERGGRRRGEREKERRREEELSLIHI